MGRPATSGEKKGKSEKNELDVKRRAVCKERGVREELTRRNPQRVLRPGSSDGLCIEQRTKNNRLRRCLVT